MTASLAAMGPCADAAALIDQLRDLEDLKSAAAARQARLAVAFDLLQRRVQAEAGLPKDELGRGVGAQIYVLTGMTGPGASLWPTRW